LSEKATDVTLFWNLSRNLDKNSSKFAEKSANFDEQNEKNQKFNDSIAKKCWRFLAEILSLKNGAQECIV